MRARIWYWGNKIGKPHTVPCKVTGKCGFVTVRMVPAPRGAGIVAALRCFSSLGLMMFSLLTGDLLRLLETSSRFVSFFLLSLCRGDSWILLIGDELVSESMNLQTAVTHIVVTSSYLPTSYITQANIAKRERNRGAKQLDAPMKELALPLKGYMEIFPRRRLLHPYERSLIELTLGDGKYEEALSKREVEDRLSEGVEKLELVFQQQGRDVDDLLSIAKVCLL
ncbi:hypothetical protein Bca4012_004137 [Brassica carinata]